MFRNGHESRAAHPLDPLTSAEIRQAVAILRRDRGVGDGWRFTGIELAEPAKPGLLAWQPGGALSRQARVTCWNPALDVPPGPGHGADQPPGQPHTRLRGR